MYRNRNERGGLRVEAGWRRHNCLLLLIVRHNAQEVAPDGVFLDLELGLVAVCLCLFCGLFQRRGFGFLELDALKSRDSEGEELVIIVI